MSWQPLLEGVLEQHACECVLAIAEDRALLSRHAGGDPSLAGGSAGAAILHRYLWQIDHQDHNAEISQSCLASALLSMEENPGSASLFSGLAGVGWTLSHLQDRAPAIDEAETLAEIDQVLLQHLEQTTWKTEYDLIYGLVGIGVYALQRLPHLAAVNILTRVIDHLAATAERRQAWTTWWTDPAWMLAETRVRFPMGYYDLGLAHGVPGVIVLLARASAADIAVDAARPLLDGSIRWLLAHQCQDGFDSWTVADSSGKPGRLAWCYGDPGVAAALLAAACSLNEPAWEYEALAIARRAARRPPDQSGVNDAGLCHGAAGLGHIFNRMYQATGDGLLGEAARYWFERTLAMHRPGQGIGGFEAWGPSSGGTTTWFADPTFLTGSAGIALALLAATTDVEPAWDQVLLVDIPPVREP